MVRNPVHQIAELRRYARAMGWSGALRLRFSDVLVRSGFSKPRFSRVKLKNSQFPLYMRAHTSDRDALSQVFIHGEYEIAQLSNPRTIIDLANAGYSAAYFLSKYPAATVLAVEPDAGNLEVCRRNLAPYGSRVKLVHGAAWPELVVEKGIYRDGRDWSTQVILFSPWGVVRKLKGSAWFPLGFVIFWYLFFLRMPATFGGMVAYEDFLLNAYFWLLLGVLFRLPTLALSAKFAADSPSAPREHRWIR